MKHIIALSILMASTGALASPPTRPKRLFGPDISLSLEPSSAVATTSTVCARGEGSDCAEGLMMYGAATLARYEFLELGVQLESSATVFAGETHVFWSGLAGVELDTRGWARLELLAEMGVHSIEDVGDAFVFGATEDVDVSMPFAGLRAGASARVGHGAARFVAGLWFAFRADLEHRARTVAESSFCVLTCGSDSTTYDLGGTTAQVGLRLGVEVR